MPTQHEYRVHLIVPVARVAAFNAWVAANIDPLGGDWLTPSLNADGTAQSPRTHAECSAALTPPEMRQMMVRLCTLAGIAQPAGWDGWTRAQRKTWFADQLDAIQAATGIRVRASDNDGEWSNHDTDRVALGLRRAAAN